MFGTNLPNALPLLLCLGLMSVKSGSDVSLPPCITESDCDSGDHDVELPPCIGSETQSDVDCETMELPPDVLLEDEETIELPPDILLDECEDDPESGELSLGEFVSDFQSSGGVPQPTDCEMVVGLHDVAEFYSCPRVLPATARLGLVGSLSLDILTGWGFAISACRELALQMLIKLDVLFAMMSPPCTAFSILQRMWNYKKMDPKVVKAKLDEGKLRWNHAVACCKTQLARGRFFALEHPVMSDAWKLNSSKKLGALHGVYNVIFDQCMVGLRSKVHGVPMRKRTRLMTNSLHLKAAFEGMLCDGRHEHQVIQGVEGGVRRSVWSQVYPPPMVEAIAKAAQQMQR